MSNQNTSPWTPSMERRLRFLVLEGYDSATVIATLKREFGVTFSKNAVIRKAGRMKLDWKGHRREERLNERLSGSRRGPDTSS